MSFSAKAPAVRRMCEPEVQNLLEVIPWTITPTANDLLPGWNCPQETRNLNSLPAAVCPSPSMQIPRAWSEANVKKGRCHCAVLSVPLGCLCGFCKFSMLHWLDPDSQGCSEPVHGSPTASARLTLGSRTLVGSSAATMLVVWGAYVS